MLISLLVAELAVLLFIFIFVSHIDTQLSEISERLFDLTIWLEKVTGSIKSEPGDYADLK